MELTLQWEFKKLPGKNKSSPASKIYQDKKI